MPQLINGQQNDNKNFYFRFRFQAKMIAGKFTKNSIKKFQVLGKKVTASERTSTGKYKSTTKIANIKISTIKFQVKQD